MYNCRPRQEKEDKVFEQQLRYEFHDRNAV